jgi:hypothetical protein
MFGMDPQNNPRENNGNEIEGEENVQRHKYIIAGAEGRLRIIPRWEFARARLGGLRRLRLPIPYSPRDDASHGQPPAVRANHCGR